MTGNTDMHLLVTDAFKKKSRGVDQKTSRYLLIVACGMLSHSSSMAVQSCWILAGTGTFCHARQSRASQTCSMGDMSGEYACHGRTGTFSASRNCDPCDMGPRIIMLKHEVVGADES